MSGCCIWKKQSLVLGRSPYQWQHEPCLYGWKKNGKHQWYTGRKETTMGSSSKPKTLKQIAKWLRDPHSDSAEYKMWGNGVALPCVVFVLSGIVYCTQSEEK